MEDKLDKNVKIIDEPIGMENQFKGMSQAMVNCLARHIDKDGSVLIIDPKKCTSNDDKQLIGLDMFQKDGVSVNGYVIAKSCESRLPKNLSEEQMQIIMSNTNTKVFLSINKEDIVGEEAFKNAAWKLDLDGGK